MNWLTSRCASLAALAALALTGCDEGTDLNVTLPDTAGINTEYLDLDVVSGTVRLAPVQTLKADHFLVGRLNDNIAGTTEAQGYFNVLDAKEVSTVLRASNLAVTDTLPATLASTTVTPLLDSVVLVMGFDRVYGSTTTPVRYNVYDLAAPLDERQVYNSASALPLGNALGLNLTSRLDRTTTQIVTAAVAATSTTPAIPAVTTTVPDQTVRLVLQRTAVQAGTGQPAIPGVPSAFADGLFTSLKQSSFSQTQLNTLLKGLAIQPSTSHPNALVAFSKAYKSRILVYYHAGTLRRSYSVYFGPAYSGLGYASARDPRYFTQITSTLPSNLSILNSRDGFVPNTLLNGTSYAQEGTGLGTRINFAGLTALMGKEGLTINRAEIRVPVKPFSNALFLNPRQLYLAEVDANNNLLQRTIGNLPADRLVQADGSNQLGSGSPTFGVLTDFTTTQPYYNIPVTSYLQAYLASRLEGNPTALVLLPDSSTPVVNSNGVTTINLYSTLMLSRVAIDAPNIKLRVYYSQR